MQRLGVCHTVGSNAAGTAMPNTSTFWLLPAPMAVLPLPAPIAVLPQPAPIVLLLLTLSLLELRATKPGGRGMLLLFRLICGMRLTMNGWRSASLADIRSRGFLLSSAVIMLLASSLSFDHTDGLTFRSAYSRVEYSRGRGLSLVGHMYTDRHRSFEDRC